MSELPRELAEALDRVEVGADLRSATVADREVTADNVRTFRGVLAGALYDLLHAGRPHRDGRRRKSVRDPEFETALREMVPHRMSRVLAPVHPDSPTVVTLSGVRVRVPEERLAEEVETAGGRARWVRLPAVLPALSPGFLLVNGSLGTGLGQDHCLRLYLGVTEPPSVAGLWGAALGRLEELAVPYRAKVLSARDLYPRRDAIVVYLGPQAWHVVPEIARAAVAAGGLRPDVSAYVARLGEGIGWAWEPEDPRPEMRDMSFGEHRSHAVATGLLAHAEGQSPGDRDAAVADALRAAGVVPGQPHRNSGSPGLPFEDPAETAACPA
ncbi:T3SS effector HopA1 family protein [Microbispora sp. CA-135349]|uniref:T3SS effector HopA1 family protein n=1 Tax=Microbispora sp. CA-135349 TaxID=3239953 RepID=UPI003D8EDE3C